MKPASPNPRHDPDGRDDAPLQLAARLMSLVKSGAAWSAKHVTFVQQLENYLALLAPVLRDAGHVAIDAPDGDVRLNGDVLPYRAGTHRALEQLAQEFGARAIAGVEFVPGITVREFRSFMELFLLGERWKGGDLIAACQDAGIEHVHALPLRPAAAERPAEPDAGVSPQTLGQAHEAWIAFLEGAEQLLAGNALDHGVELRHLKRMARPLVESVLADGRATAALLDVSPGETVSTHAAHVALAAVCLGRSLGLGRHDLAALAVAGLLHDVGHGWAEPAGEPAAGRGAAPHTLEGVRRIAWATTFNADSLDAMRAALEHHAGALRADGERPAPFSRVIGVADAYVTLVAHGAARSPGVAPSVALARVLETVCAGGPPALGIALVRALGFYPPGQLVELDDGTTARTVAPVADEPERPWVQLVADERGLPLARGRRPVMPLPEGRRIVRALPRDPWPTDPAARPAA